MQKELWKPIKNFEGLYEVSNYGRIKILEKKQTFTNIMRNGGSISSFSRTRKERIASPLTDNLGYLSVGLWKCNRQKRKRVHRLVAEHFLPEIFGKRFVNHIDGKKKNNNVNNLEWCTASENERHAVRIGIKGKLKSERHKLISCIKEGVLNTKELARLFCITERTVRQIRKDYC